MYLGWWEEVNNSPDRLRVVQLSSICWMMPIEEDGPCSGETTKGSDELYRVRQEKERQTKVGWESEMKNSALDPVGWALQGGNVPTAWCGHVNPRQTHHLPCVVAGVCRQQVTQGQLGLGHLKFLIVLQKRSPQLVVQKHLGFFCGQSRSVLFSRVFMAAVPGGVCCG